MKRLILLALIGISIISCTEEKPVKDYLIISGKIKNFKKKEILLINALSVKKIKFNKKTGSFSDTLRLSRDGYYTFKANKKQFNLYLTDTVDTKINFDYKDIDGVKFEGTNAGINSYFFNKSKKFSEIIVNAKKLFSLEEQDFLAKMDEYKDVLTELSISNNLPPELLKSEVKNIDYEYRRNLSNYEDFYKTLSGDKDFVVSKDFPDPLKNFNYSSSSDYMDSYSYRKVLETQIDAMSKEKIKDDGKDYYLTYQEIANSKVKDTLVKNRLLYLNAKAGITYTDDLKKFHDNFMLYSTNKTYNKEISENYNNLKVIAKGEVAPKFKDFENYNGGTTSLDDLLGKGKYIYIDVWATWCGFCKREIPLLKKLEEEYHGKNIEFVSISVDDKKQHEKWRQTIVDREMTGVQLFSGKKQAELEWAQNFLITGLPKFIIIDPEGKIVNSNAPAPSQGSKLIDIFDQLNI